MAKLTFFYGISIMNMIVAFLSFPMDIDNHMGRSKLYNLNHRICIEKAQKKQPH